MLCLKCTETKPISSICSVISLTLYAQDEVLKILLLQSPTSPKSSCSAKLDRYRCLEEEIILIHSFCFLAAFSKCFSQKYSISNISQKKSASFQTSETALTGCLWMLLLHERSCAVGLCWLTQDEEASCT